MKKQVEQLCAEQITQYPALETQDLVKALYQATFGCGHLISDPEMGRKWLRDEMEQCTLPASDSCPPLVESLGSYSRVHLQTARTQGLSPDTLFALFALSAQENSGRMDDFQQQLKLLEQTAENNQLPLPLPKVQAYLAEYKAQGCPAARHSPAFRQAYAPAYRVIRSEYTPFLPVFTLIDRLMMANKPITIAIEGGSASGKSTLGQLLMQIYDCSLFHMDDFFLQPHQRTPERFSEPGGNVDYERFKEEVLLPLRNRTPFAYRPFSCSTMTLAEPVHVLPKQLCVVEGAYSMHPTLADDYNASVFLQIQPDKQAERILQRNGPVMQQRFLNEWIPLEMRYFEHCKVQERCTLTIPIQ